MSITPESRIETVLGNAGPKKLVAFRDRLGLQTVEDLLRHRPRRYLETGTLSQVDDFVEGQVLTVVGRIGRSKAVSYTDRRTGRAAFRTEVQVLTDGTSFSLVYFSKTKNIADFHERTYRPGRTGVFIGKPRRFREDWQLTNPDVILFDADDDAGTGAPALSRLFPLYPLTSGVTNMDVQQVVAAARTFVDALPEVVPAPVRERYRLPGPDDVLHLLHTPDTQAEVARAHRYLRFEEALITQAVLARRRAAVRALGTRRRDGGDGALLRAFDASLPFELTRGQRAIGEEIEADLAGEHPMNRLLQGEVGSGKTLVALRAMLRVIDSGGQAALLAPTEVLAQQHHRSLTAMLGDLAGGAMFGGTSVELLTGSMTRSQRTGPLSRLASGEAGMVVGTHALLEDTVMFADLGLVVVDEQHRFGVEQRAALTAKTDGVPPHLLVMTATPIPRTVAMTVFGDLEVSVLDELPAGRAPIQTTAVHLLDHPHWYARVWERVREEVARGHQVYVVCPRISSDDDEPVDGAQLPIDLPDPDGSEDPGPAGPAAPQRPLAAVEDVVRELGDGPLDGLRLAPLHGRLRPEDKDATMRAFAAGELDVLVSTTVIEVGVDVANATTMVILDAERFGISQLHQLRGRVGRGGLPGLCLLVSSAAPDTPARVRLDAVAATTDGFELSRLDLDQRREGDVLGRAQSGFRTQLESLRVLRDEKTILQAREAVEELLGEGPPPAAGESDPLDAWPVLAERVRSLEARAAAEMMVKS
ncbi:ATP-dependent DNA helicase RecG [Nocardioides sp.]|uniref:ATP-dependent DNA helicase RecG n=1 Tax=Nocardioides sp. TaxID=35761 RepID=UPI0035163F9F